MFVPMYWSAVWESYITMPRVGSAKVLLKADVVQIKFNQPGNEHFSACFSCSIFFCSNFAANRYIIALGLINYANFYKNCQLHNFCTLTRSASEINSGTKLSIFKPLLTKWVFRLCDTITKALQKAFIICIFSSTFFRHRTSCQITSHPFLSFVQAFLSAVEHRYWGQRRHKKHLSA